MSVCNCPIVGIDGVESSEQKKFVASFLNSIAPDGYYAKSNWSLLSLIDMVKVGNDPQVISGVVPFRGGSCMRTTICCGQCTRRCTHRCVQDCLHRLYLWHKLVESTPEDERDQLPLNVRLIVNQKFDSHAHLSWVVGEILSRNTNSVLKEYMDHEKLRRTENPYKIDYAPQAVLDSRTGKRVYNPANGEIRIAYWPQSGLCPYCLPSTTVDGRVLKQRSQEHNFLG